MLTTEALVAEIRAEEEKTPTYAGAGMEEY
jgi:hypothetical protein